MTERKQKKLGLSLRGGGARCASYLGFIKALEENDIEIHAIIGASGGAIAGGSYAALRDYEKCVEHFEKFTPGGFIGLDSLRDLHIASDDMTIEFARELVGDVKIKDTKIPMYIQVTNVDSGEPTIIEEGELAKTSIASSAMPWMVKPIEIDGQRYIDGDIGGGFATSFLKSKGCDAVIGLCPGYAYAAEANTNRLANLVRPVDIMTKQIRLMDQLLDPVDLMFEGIASGYGIGDFKKSREIAEHGYEIAEGRMDEIKELL